MNQLVDFSWPTQSGRISELWQLWILAAIEAVAPHLQLILPRSMDGEATKLGEARLLRKNPHTPVLDDYKSIYIYTHTVYVTDFRYQSL